MTSVNDNLEHSTSLEDSLLQRSLEPFIDNTMRLCATGLGSGYAPYASGTVGSFTCLIGWWFLRGSGAISSGLGEIAIALLLGAIALLSTDLYLNSVDTSGRRKPGDPGEIVIDEWLGMWISLLFVPHEWGFAPLLAFALFRFFDVFKPWPIRRLEALPGALGVVADDAAAGLLSCLIFHLVW